jgi:hypothetical protein
VLRAGNGRGGQYRILEGLCELCMVWHEHRHQQMQSAAKLTDLDVGKCQAKKIHQSLATNVIGSLQENTSMSINLSAQILVPPWETASHHIA